MEGSGNTQNLDYSDDPRSQALTGTNTIELVEKRSSNGQTTYDVLLKIHGLVFETVVDIPNSNSQLIFAEDGLVHYSGEITVTRPVPNITSELVQKHGTGSAFHYTVTAENDPSSFSIANAPNEMTIDATSGEITWQTPRVGTYEIELTTTNAIGTDAQTLQLTVGAPPELVSNPYSESFTLLKGQTYNLANVTFSNADSYLLKNEPQALTLTGSGTEISWTPETIGDFSAELVARNEFGNARATLRFTVIDHPSITNGREITQSVSEDLNHQIETSHPVSNFSFSPSATQPHYSDASLSNDGILQFTPSGTGNYTFEIQFNVGESILTDSIIVSVVSPLEHWAINQFGQAEDLPTLLLETDTFGIPPLERFAYNLPLEGRPTELSEDGNSGLPRITFDPEAQKLSCSFIRRLDANLSNIRYVVEFSDDLSESGWELKDPTLATYIDTVVEKISVDDSTGPSDTPKRFARVRIIMN